MPIQPGDAIDSRTDLIVIQDGQTKKHLGYIMLDTTEEVSEKILSQDEHYVQTMNPTGYNESSGPFVASRYKCTLQDVINSLRLEGSPSADKPASSEIQKILQVKVEQATEGISQFSYYDCRLTTLPYANYSQPPIIGAFGQSKPMQQPIGNLPGQLQFRAPNAYQLQDLLALFDGFAKPGRLRRTIV